MATIDQRIENLRSQPHDPACLEIVDALLAKLYEIQRSTTDLVVKAGLLNEVSQREKDELLHAGWLAAARSCTDIESSNYGLLRD